ncbi:hypothetical protein J6590_030746 [Homalodisca vitripennis]|nr:hypothetical protein J6590_030746 [Homalodisca vitripennis]
MIMTLAEPTSRGGEIERKIALVRERELLLRHEQRARHECEREGGSVRAVGAREIDIGCHHHWVERGERTKQPRPDHHSTWLGQALGGYQCSDTTHKHNGSIQHLNSVDTSNIIDERMTTRSGTLLPRDS